MNKSNKRNDMKEEFDTTEQVVTEQVVEQPFIDSVIEAASTINDPSEILNTIGYLVTLIESHNSSSGLELGRDEIFDLVDKHMKAVEFSLSDETRTSLKAEFDIDVQYYAAVSMLVLQKEDKQVTLNLHKNEVQGDLEYISQEVAEVIGERVIVEINDGIDVITDAPVLAYVANIKDDSTEVSASAERAEYNEMLTKLDLPTDGRLVKVAVSNGQGESTQYTLSPEDVMLAVNMFIDDNTELNMMLTDANVTTEDKTDFMLVFVDNDTTKSITRLVGNDGEIIYEGEAIVNSTLNSIGIIPDTYYDLELEFAVAETEPYLVHSSVLQDVVKSFIRGGEYRELVLQLPKTPEDATVSETTVYISETEISASVANSTENNVVIAYRK